MIESENLMKAADYARIVRPLLPSDAFRPQRTTLWQVAGHLTVIFGFYVLLREFSAWWLRPLCALVVGHSIACMAFVAHDISHHTVVSSRWLRKVLEIFLWGLNLIPPTVWRRVHNQTHHVETNTPRDPDRPFMEHERSLSTAVYSRVFYPSPQYWRGSPLIFFHFIPYIIRNTVAALMPGNSKPEIVPAKPHYTVGQIVSVISEIMVIAVAQTLLWHFLKGSWSDYLWASPAAILVTSSVAMMYVFTNHFLNPICEHTDPLVGSTSVVVPRWMNWLHDNFSYHTEHHLFPSMNPKFYPLVSDILKDKFPDRYNRITLGEAWARLWERDEFVVEAQVEVPTQELEHSAVETPELALRD